MNISFELYLQVHCPPKLVDLTSHLHHLALPLGRQVDDLAAHRAQKLGVTHVGRQLEQISSVIFIKQINRLKLKEDNFKLKYIKIMF